MKQGVSLLARIEGMGESEKKPSKITFPYSVFVLRERERERQRETEGQKERGGAERAGERESQVSVHSLTQGWIP